MGHKRHRIRGDFSNVNPGRGGPGITENGYPPHLVVVSVEHPEINPKGVTVENFTEEVTEEKTFGTNVGKVIEDFINNQNDNSNNEEDTTMNDEQNTKETINNETINQNNPNKETETTDNNVNKETKNMNTNPNNTNNNVNQENINMNNANANVNPNGTIDDGSNSNNVNQKPSLAKEAASAFVVGAAYGAGTITAVLGISLLAAGIRKLCSGTDTAAGDAAETTETVETVAEAFLR